MAIALFLRSLHAEMILTLTARPSPCLGAPSGWVTCLFASCNTMSSKWYLGIPFPLAGGSLIIIPWRGGWCHDHLSVPMEGQGLEGVPGSRASHACPRYFHWDRQRGESQGSRKILRPRRGSQTAGETRRERVGVADPCSCQAQ